MQSRDGHDPQASPSVALMPVSISRSVFSKRFLEALLPWLTDRSIVAIQVVLFDRLEEYNYRVFRKDDELQARHTALRRAEELLRMFRKFKGRFEQAGVDLIANSQRSFELSPDFAEIYERLLQQLWNAFDNEGLFAVKVRSQVHQNLAAREECFGYEFIEEQMDSLVSYLLEELAFFEAFMEFNGPYFEIYPGSMMSIRGDLRAGSFSSLSMPSERADGFLFFDVSGLHSSSYEGTSSLSDAA